MNSTVRAVMDISSPVRVGTLDNTGPLVTIRRPPIMPATMLAMVVLPVPAGPLNSRCGTRLCLALAPSMTIRTRSSTSACPTIWSSVAGRSSLCGSAIAGAGAGVTGAV